MNMRIQNGWAIITAGSLEIRVPVDDLDGGDDRVEIRRYDHYSRPDGTRLFVEPIDDTITATAPERFS